MKHLIQIALAALFVPLMAACSGGGGGGGDAGEVGETLSEAAVADMSISDVADQVVADGQTLSTLLAGVKDTDTAEAVEPQIKAIIENYQLMFERVENTQNLGFADMAALATRAPEIAETQEAVMQELMRIYREHPEAADVLREALRDFGQP